jgi:hypothetical protein
MTGYNANTKNAYCDIALSSGTFPLGLLKAGLFTLFTSLNLNA